MIEVKTQNCSIGLTSTSLKNMLWITKVMEILISIKCNETNENKKFMTLAHQKGNKDKLNPKFNIDRWG